MKTVSLASSKKKNTLTRANTEIFPPEAENTVRCDELEENSSLHSGLTQNMNKLTIQDHQETSFDEQTPSDLLEELDGTSGQHCGLTQKINELSLGQDVDLDVGATTGGVFAPNTLSSTGLTQQLEQLTLEADTREDEEHLQLMPEPSNRRVLDRETRGKVEQGEDDGAAVTPNDETEKEDFLQLAGAKWGPLEGSEIATKLNEVFLEVARWRRNIFYLPTGKAGEDFIEELSRIFEMFSSGSAFEPVALTMAVVIFPLVLQKPTRDSKAADHKRYLEKRLKAWKTGELDDLLKEGRVIQKRLNRKKKSKSVRKEKRFIQLMEAGKVSAALRCIGSQETSVLDTTPEVLQQLRDKHPPSENPHIRSLIQGPLPRKPVEQVIYEEINGTQIYKAAKSVSGAAGPSGADADLWIRLLCSKQFKSKPAGLCKALAAVARKLNTSEVNAQYLRALVAGRLIPLDKKPGVRPIGIGDVVRRIISRATTMVLKPELVESTAPLQTCAGLKGGIEASIHAIRRKYEDEETEGTFWLTQVMHSTL